MDFLGRFSALEISFVIQTCRFCWCEKKNEALLSHKGSWCHDHSQAVHIGDMTYLKKLLLVLWVVSFGEWSFSEPINTSWWLNQPLWKLCSSNWIISPRFGMKIKHIWNHHLEQIHPRSLTAWPWTNGGLEDYLDYWKGNFSGSMLNFGRVSTVKSMEDFGASRERWGTF